MPLTDSIGAYEDCFGVFERASNDKDGARVQFRDFSEAKQFQMRMNYARTLQRRDSTRVYEPDHHLFNRSAYDTLIVRHPREDDQGFWWVYVEHQGRNILAIESLSEEPTDVVDNPN